MKNLILFLTLVCFPFLLEAQGSLGLIAHWKFNGNIIDSSGHGMNGTNLGVIPGAGFSGAANTAMYFKGLDTPTSLYSHIEIPYNPVMNVINYSICALLKPTGFNTNTCQVSCILNRGFHTGTSVRKDMILFEMGDNFYDEDCNIFSPNNFYFQSTPITSAMPGAPELYPQPVQLNTWYCVVATFDGDSVRLYIDGSLKKTVYRQTVMQPTTEGMAIGMSYDYVINNIWPFPFIGYMDDMRLYNRKLSTLEANTYCDSVRSIPTTAIETGVNKNDVIIYPNPAKDDITIQIQDSQNEEAYYTITNLYGQTLLKRTKLAHDTTIVSLSAYPAGMYLVTVSVKGQTTVRSVLKDR